MYLRNGLYETIKEVLDYNVSNKALGGPEETEEQHKINITIALLDRFFQ